MNPEQPASRAARFALVALLASPPLVLVAPRAAFAQQGGDAETGRQLFQYGRGYYEQSRWAEALDAFRGSLDKLPSPNTRLYIGRCLRELGRFGEAWSELELTADESDARRAQDPRYGRTADVARQESSALASRVAFLVVDFQQPQPGASVTVNGRALPSERWGRLYAVDPGSVTVDAVAGGYAPFRATSTLAAGQQGRVQVMLQPAGAASTVAPVNTVTVLAASDPGALPISSVAAPATQTSPWRTIGIVTASIGIAAGVGGLVTGLRAASIRGDLDARCPQGCGPNPPADVVAAVDEGSQQALITNILWGTGAALFIGGAIAFFAGGGSAQELYTPTYARSTPRPRFTLRPMVDAPRGIVGVGGTF